MSDRAMLPVVACIAIRDQGVDATYAAVALCAEHRDSARKWRDHRYDPWRPMEIGRAPNWSAIYRNIAEMHEILRRRWERLSTEQIHLIAGICARQCDIAKRHVVVPPWTSSVDGRLVLVVPEPRPVLEAVN